MTIGEYVKSIENIEYIVIQKGDGFCSGLVEEYTESDLNQVVKRCKVGRIRGRYCLDVEV